MFRTSRYIYGSTPTSDRSTFAPNKDSISSWITAWRVSCVIATSLWALLLLHGESPVVSLHPSGLSYYCMESLLCHRHNPLGSPITAWRVSCVIATSLWALLLLHGESPVSSPHPSGLFYYCMESLLWHRYIPLGSPITAWRVSCVIATSLWALLLLHGESPVASPQPSGLSWRVSCVIATPLWALMESLLCHRHIPLGSPITAWRVSCGIATPLWALMESLLCHRHIPLGSPITAWRVSCVIATSLWALLLLHGESPMSSPQPSGLSWRVSCVIATSLWALLLLHGESPVSSPHPSELSYPPI